MRKERIVFTCIAVDDIHLGGGDKNWPTYYQDAGARIWFYNARAYATVPCPKFVSFKTVLLFKRRLS